MLLGLGQTVSADVVLTMGGDVNFNKNRNAVYADGVQYGAERISWKSFTQNLKPLINGDLNFANIETVVSSSNDLSDEDKKFAFKSHPNAVQNLIDLGFNLFNLANNHTYDYGHPGIRQTALEMAELRQQNPRIAYHGVGFRQDLIKPLEFDLNGIRFAFATASIGDPQFQARNDRPGMLFIRDDRDYQQLVQNFAKSKADFKILSIHFGTEGKTELDVGQRTRFEYALKHGGVNLIIGHHPHVIRPIQKKADGMIFYSLGNYLMLGSADITKKLDINTDWGMFSRLYLERDPYSGKVKIDAVEVIPLTNTHARVAPMPGMKAAQRIAGINALSEIQLGAEAFRLKVDSLTGRGIFCSSEMNSVRAKTMCSSRF